MAKDRAEMVAAAVEDASTEGRSEGEIEVMLTGMGRDTLERMSLLLIAANRRLAREHAQMLATLTSAQRIGSSQLEELRAHRLGEMAPIVEALGVARQSGARIGASGYTCDGAVSAMVTAKSAEVSERVRGIEPGSPDALSVAVAAARLFLGR